MRHANGSYRQAKTGPQSQNGRQKTADAKPDHSGNATRHQPDAKKQQLKQHTLIIKATFQKVKALAPDRPGYTWRLYRSSLFTLSFESTGFATPDSTARTLTSGIMVRK